MTEKERMARLVCFSVKRALSGQTPKRLRAYSFAIDHDAKRILLRGHFGESPNYEDLEALSVVESEIDADFLDHFEAETETETVPPGKDLSLLSGGVAYLRDGEPGQICAE